MKKHLKLSLCALILLSGPALVWAADFGVILDQTASYGGSVNDVAEKDNAFEYSGALIPRFSVTGEHGGMYISASANVDWKDKTLSYVPELLRTELSWGFRRGEIKLGRMPYVDPLGIIAAGLFDGVNISLDAGEGSVSVGGWYTGFLYRERAHITMTPSELEAYNTAVDYKDFFNTYFAPRRAVAALGWEHEGLGEFVQMQCALVGQVDLGEEDALNSQYGVVKLSLPVNALVITLGGCLEVMEYMQDYKFALAGVAGIDWMFTSARLSLSGRYSSGVGQHGSLMAFLPLTTIYQGNILQAKLSGISVVSLDYLSRLMPAFSAGLGASCFVRSDLGTYDAYPISANAGDGRILGTELFARFLWSPISDIQVNLGSGGFVPMMGNTDRDAAILWRVELNVIFALY